MNMSGVSTRRQNKRQHTPRPTSLIQERTQPMPLSPILLYLHHETSKSSVYHTGSFLERPRHNMCRRQWLHTAPLLPLGRPIMLLSHPRHSSVRATTGPKLPHQEVVHAGAHSPHTSYFTYLQIVLVCLFCGGFLWSRCRRHIRSRSSRPQDRRGTFATFEKSAVKEAV
jgi:hypothetical protein